MWSCRRIAGVLQDQLRATDVGGRYGGEEYLVILVGNDREGSLMAAERWRQAIDAASFKAPDGQQISITVSIGVAVFHSSFETVEDLVGAADAALYQAKEGGRNRVACGVVPDLADG